MCFIIAIGALVGFWLDGVLGFLVGGAMGWGVAALFRAAASTGLHKVHAHFIDTTFAVMGALCKADGVVTRDEIRVVEQIFAQLRLSPEQKDAAKAAFGRGKAPGFDLDAAVRHFAEVAPRGGSLSQLFLQLQLMAVAADGQVHPAERAMLIRIARGLGLAEIDVARLEALLRAAARGPAMPGDAMPSQRLDDAYSVLGVRPEASETEIRRAYRKMIRDNHPDRIAAQGLPESMREIAEKRAREINAAYDLIKQVRQIS